MEISCFLSVLSLVPPIRQLWTWRTLSGSQSAQANWICFATSRPMRVTSERCDTAT